MQNSGVTLNRSMKTCNLCANCAFQMSMIISFEFPCNGCSLSNIYDALGCWRVSLVISAAPGLCSLLSQAGVEIDWLINYLINQQQQHIFPIIYLCRS